MFGENRHTQVDIDGADFVINGELTMKASSTTNTRSRAYCSTPG